MIGAGEFFLPAFVLVLAMGDVASGWIITLPPLVGAIVQVLGARAVRVLGSHKRWVLLTVWLQALCWVPLAFGAAIGQMHLWMVFACATAYYVCGMGGGAAWSMWIGTVVPRSVRARYFGRRNRAIQAWTLVGFWGGALALSLATNFKPPTQGGDPRVVLTVLACLFGAAGVARAVSAWHLMRVDEPVPMPANHRHVGVRELWRRIRTGERGGDARLLVYVASVWLATNVAAPFVNPYLLSQRAEKYLVWACLIGLVVLGKVGTLLVLGPLAHRHGARTLLVVGGIGIVPISAMLALGDAYWWLVLTQLFSGAMWACWELGLWLLVLEKFKDEERTSLMGYYFLLNQSCQALGALLGGLMLAELGKDRDAYSAVFIASTIARLMTVAVLFLIVIERRRPPDSIAPNEPADQTVTAETRAWEEGRAGE